MSITHTMKTKKTLGQVFLKTHRTRVFAKLRGLTWKYGVEFGRGEIFPSFNLSRIFSSFLIKFIMVQFLSRTLGTLREEQNRKYCAGLLNSINQCFLLFA